MSLLVIQHPVADFDSWKKAFDSDPLGRAASGVTRYTIHRATDDPGYVVVGLEFDSRETAEKFLARLREMWTRVGPRIGFGSAEGVQTRIFDEVEHIELQNR